MKIVQTLCLTAALAVSHSSLAAAPFCDAFLDADSLEKRYKKLAPLQSSTKTGWIFGADQFETDYRLNAPEEALLKRLVETFAQSGTQLAIMVAPPRPAVAGQSLVDSTTGQDVSFDVAGQAQVFEQMIEQFNAAGAIAPNLLETAQGMDGKYYFMRDTHWTSTGAAGSALAMATALNGPQSALFELAQLEMLEQFNERGSLADIARATCDVDPAAETTPVFDYSPLLPHAGGLLGDESAGSNQVILVGTSFSNRYKRDQYQVADALSAATGTPVRNLSISGGGMTGPLESYLLSGQFEKDAPSVLVWEFPSTYQLSEVHLRQILGALRARKVATPTKRLAVSDDKVTVSISSGSDLIGFDFGQLVLHKVSVKIRLEGGDVIKLPLRRNKRAFGDEASGPWWIDLSGLARDIKTIEIALPKGADLSTVTLFEHSAGS